MDASGFAPGAALPTSSSAPGSVPVSTATPPSAAGSAHESSQAQKPAETGTLAHRNDYIAWFSTRGGEWPPRPFTANKSRPRLIHARPDAAIHSMIKDYRAKWPHECYSIFAKSSEGHEQWQVYWFFDEYDFHTLGPEFVTNLLLRMQTQNEEEVVHFACRWFELYYNPAIDVETLAFDDTFTLQDMAVYGAEFLKITLRYIKLLDKLNHPSSTSAPPMAVPSTILEEEETPLGLSNGRAATVSPPKARPPPLVLSNGHADIAARPTIGGDVKPSFDHGHDIPMGKTRGTPRPFDKKKTERRGSGQSPHWSHPQPQEVMLPQFPVQPVFPHPQGAFAMHGNHHMLPMYPSLIGPSFGLPYGNLANHMPASPYPVNMHMPSNAYPNELNADSSRPYTRHSPSRGRGKHIRGRGTRSNVEDGYEYRPEFHGVMAPQFPTWSSEDTPRGHGTYNARGRENASMRQPRGALHNRHENRASLSGAPISIPKGRPSFKIQKAGRPLNKQTDELGYSPQDVRAQLEPLDTTTGQEAAAEFVSDSLPKLTVADIPVVPALPIQVPPVDSDSGNGGGPSVASSVTPVGSPVPEQVQSADAVSEECHQDLQVQDVPATTDSLALVHLADTNVDHDIEDDSTERICLDTLIESVKETEFDSIARVVSGDATILDEQEDLESMSTSTHDSPQGHDTTALRLATAPEMRILSQDIETSPISEGRPKSPLETLEEWQSVFDQSWRALPDLPDAKQKDWTRQLTELQNDLKSLDFRFEESQKKLATATKYTKKKERVKSKQIKSAQKEKVESLVLLSYQLRDILSKPGSGVLRAYPKYNAKFASQVLQPEPVKDAWPNPPNHRRQYLSSGSSSPQRGEPDEHDGIRRVTINNPRFYLLVTQNANEDKKDEAAVDDSEGPESLAISPTEVSHAANSTDRIEGAATLNGSNQTQFKCLSHPHRHSATGQCELNGNISHHHIQELPQNTGQSHAEEHDRNDAPPVGPHIPKREHREVPESGRLTYAKVAALPKTKRPPPLRVTSTPNPPGVGSPVSPGVAFETPKSPRPGTAGAQAAVNSDSDDQWAAQGADWSRSGGFRRGG